MNLKNMPTISNFVKDLKSMSNFFLACEVKASDEPQHDFDLICFHYWKQ